MPDTIYARLYKRFTNLFPDLNDLHEGSAYFASPRVQNDWAIYCTVAKVDGDCIDLEFAHDQVVDGEEQPAPWMAFRVDTQSHTAELLALHDEWRYEVVYSDTNKASPRRGPLNMYAANWLTIISNMQSVFQPVVAPFLVAA